MKKTFGAIFLSAALCAGLLATPALAASDACPAWAQAAVDRWALCEKLDPALDYGHALTRGELAVALDSVLAPAAPGLNTYSDLDAAAPETGAMLRLAGAGVLGGDGTGRMWPQRTVTRQEAAVILTRAFGFQAQGAADYADADQLAPWAADAAAALQQNGVMAGSEGRFYPGGEITYAEGIQAITSALDLTGTVTALSVAERSADGVLAEGQSAHVNDGKFQVAGVTATEDGFDVELKGLSPLTGQAADADGTCRPAQAGKWMGLRLQFSGLMRVEQYQYSQDGKQWIALERNEAVPEADRVNSVIVFVNGAEKPAADSPEVEKTSTVTFRLAEGGKTFTVRFHYTPAA